VMGGRSVGILRFPGPVAVIVVVSVMMFVE
jgi:hypothetical protein